MDYVNTSNVVAALIGGGVVGFGVAFWVYHKNKVARDFNALVQSVKDAIKGNGGDNTPAA